jgi:spoIIIJ-associated protein
MTEIIKAGATIEAALAAAVKDLNTTEAMVTYTVLDAGAKGLFGIGARPAKVKVEKRKDAEEMTKELVRELTLFMGLNVTIESQKRDRHLYLDLKGENMGILIGKRGQTLDALQYIVNLSIPREKDNDFGVVIDTENYRRRRRDTLEGLARSSARKAKETKRPVKLEPMSRFERHVIHTVLQYDKTLKTLSEGNEPARYVVISPK